MGVSPWLSQAEKGSIQSKMMGWVNTKSMTAKGPNLCFQDTVLQKHLYFWMAYFSFSFSINKICGLPSKIMNLRGKHKMKGEQKKGRKDSTKPWRHRVSFAAEDASRKDVAD